MHDPTTANTFFTVLTLLANAAVVGLAALGVAALVSSRGRHLAGAVVGTVGPNARGLALLVAATATAGSLYYSEVVGFTPCELCWFQRICMYPLVAVLAVGVLRRRDRTAGWYAAPLVAVGAPLGLYHWLVERVPSIAASTSCSLAAPVRCPLLRGTRIHHPGVHGDERVPADRRVAARRPGLDPPPAEGELVSPQSRRPAKKPASTSTSWPWWVVGAALVIAGVVAVALSAGGSSSSSSGSGGATFNGLTEIGPHVTVTGTRLPMLNDPTNDPAIGKTAPTLTGVAFKGTPVTIGPTGQAHVVIFVAHWCPHCQAEVPRIVALANAGQIPVPIVTVATGTDPSAPNYPPSSWLAREGWPYPVMVDTKTETAATAYGLPGYPFLVFVNAQGQVVGRLSGEIAPSDLTKLFTALAAGKPLPGVSAGASSPGK